MEDNKVLQHLAYLNTLQPGFKFQRFIEFPCPWISYSSDNIEQYINTYGLPNHREILNFEIVIDVDSETKEAGKLHADILEQVLNQKKLKYKRWYSGGTGQHFHLNYRLFHMKQLSSWYTIGEIRLAFLKHIIPKSLMKVTDSKICLHNKTLIQIEYMLHRKGGTKTLLSQVEGINEIPKEIYSTLSLQKSIALENKRLQEANLKSMTKKRRNEQIPECIRFFEGEEIHSTSLGVVQDGIYRILFALVNFYLQREMPAEDLEELMIAWRDNLPTEWLSKSKKKVSNNIIKYMINKSNGSASCNYRSLILEDINCTHICKECPYRKVN